VKPVIGVTCGQTDGDERFYLSRRYVQALVKSGAVPLLLPSSVPQPVVAQYARLIDGLLLSGGVDVDPCFFGEEPCGTGKITPERDVFELSLIPEMLAALKPILAICRGVQVLNIAAGGCICQDLVKQVPGVIDHWQQAPDWHPFHQVALTPDTVLHNILNTGVLRVNSFHHQAIRLVAPGFRICARSRDGVIEAIEATRYPFVVGVQWHPEAMCNRDPVHQQLFTAFVEAARKK
jgi:putative glutamine amidotransferase